MRRECPEWDEPPLEVEAQRIGELLLNDPELQRILNSAAGVPGTGPIPGEIGEVMVMTGSISIPAFALSPPYDTICACNPSLPAGDWMLWSSAQWQRVYPGVFWTLGTPPAGISGNLNGGFWGGTWPPALTGVGAAAHALRSATVGLVFNVNINPGAGTFAVGNFTLQVVALRLR